jgi:hypothetical protein
MSGAPLPSPGLTTEQSRPCLTFAIFFGLVITWIAPMFVRHDLAGTAWEAIVLSELCIALIVVGMMWRWIPVLYIGTICLIAGVTHFAGMAGLGATGFMLTLGAACVTLGIYHLYCLKYP